MPLQQAAAVSHLTYFFNSFNLSFKLTNQNNLKQVSLSLLFRRTKEKCQMSFQKTAFYNGECHCSRQQPKQYKQTLHLKRQLKDVKTISNILCSV